MSPVKHARFVALAVILALVVGSLPAVVAASPAAEPVPGNLLANSSWEAGYHRQDGVPELNIPDGWRLWFLDREAFDGVPSGWLAYRPETVVWPIWQAPGDEKDLFWVDGAYTLKIFKGFAPVYAALSQDVSGLQVGQQYLFTVPMYVDIYTGVVDGKKQAPGDGGQVRLGVSGAGAEWRNVSQIAYTEWFTSGNWPSFYLNRNSFTYTFTAAAPTMTVWVEMASKYGFGNNGFFLDNLSLVPTGAGGTTFSPTPTASSTVASSPTASSAPKDVFYTVQTGDTLIRIAAKFGVSTKSIVDANKLRDANLVRLGKVLRIPGVTAPTAASTGTASATAAATPTATPAGVSSATPSDTYYTVQSGDTLARIARKFGVTESLLIQVNDLVDPNIVRLGKVLRIPGLPSATAALYTVQKGDSLGSVAAKFGVAIQALLAVNSTVGQSLTIYPGQVLNIP